MSRKLVLLALVLCVVAIACGTHNTENTQAPSGIGEGPGPGAGKTELRTTPCTFKQVEVPSVALETLPPISVLSELVKLGPNSTYSDWKEVRVTRALQNEDCSITVVAAVNFYAGGGVYEDIILIRRVQNSKVDKSFGNQGWFAFAYNKGQGREPEFSELYFHPNEDLIFVVGTVKYLHYQPRLVLFVLKKDGSLDRAYQDIPIKELSLLPPGVEIRSLKIEEISTNGGLLEIKGTGEYSGRSIVNHKFSHGTQAFSITVGRLR